MKCPHCGEFIPMELNQSSLRLPEPVRHRWPLAREFMALVWALDGSMLDATLLCMLVEDQAHSRVSSYRDLAARSNGSFGRAVIQKAMDRLKARVAEGRLARLIEPGDGEESRVRWVDVRLIRRAIASQITDVDARFLWLHEAVDGDFRDALVLSLLLQAGADRAPQRMTGRDMVKLSGGLYSHPEEMMRSFRRLSPRHGDGLLRRPEYRYWSINTEMLNALLAQRAQTWLARGAPPEPWEAGLQLALAEGSIPEAGAA